MQKLWAKPSTNDDEITLKIFQSGIEMLAENRYDDAMKNFKQCIKRAPEKIAYKQAIFSALKKISEKFIESLEKSPSKTQQRILLGYIIKHYEEMCMLFPEYVSTRKTLATYRHARYTLQSATILDDAAPENPMLIENLIFQGGGIKGLAYKSAYTTLAKLYINTKFLKRVGGTSAGGLTALPIALGYKVTELDMLVDIDFTKFFDGDCTKEFLKLIDKQEEIQSSAKDLVVNVKKASAISSPCESASGSVNASKALRKIDISNLVKLFKEANNKKMGLFKGDYFRERWAEKVIQQKTNIPYLTFRELHQLHLENGDYYKDLYIVGANVNTGEPVLFSYETTPDAIISDALRITMSIPCVFEPHKLYMKNKDGLRVPYYDPSNSKISPDDLFVDGGVMMNYPLSLFDYKRYLPGYQLQADQDSTCENPYTLGFRLVDKAYRQRVESPIISSNYFNVSQK